MTYRQVDTDLPEEVSYREMAPSLSVYIAGLQYRHSSMLEEFRSLMWEDPHLIRIKEVLSESLLAEFGSRSLGGNPGRLVILEQWPLGRDPGPQIMIVGVTSVVSATRDWVEVFFHDEVQGTGKIPEILALLIRQYYQWLKDNSLGLLPVPEIKLVKSPSVRI